MMRRPFLPRPLAPAATAARRSLLFTFAIALAAAAPACSGESAEGGEGSGAEPSGSAGPGSSGGHAVTDDQIAILDVEGFGKIRIGFFEDTAPGAVENFKKLARKGFYDGTTFHRVIPGFMIQGGDPNTKNRDPRDDGTGGPGYTIQDEFSDISHERGIVSMASTGRPNSAGSQFFIVHKDSPHLDGKYTAFGRVLSGLDVLDAIATTPRDQYGRHGPPDRPLDDVVVQSVEIVDRAAAAAEPSGTDTGDEGGAEVDAGDDAGQEQAAEPEAPGEEQ